MAEPARHPVSNDRIPDGLADDEPHAWTRRVVRVGRNRTAIQMQHHIGLAGPNTVLDGVAKLGGPRHPVLSWEHSPRLPGCDQAVSERRPLPRRADTMARPARVRIRSRNPCTRARRRLFGWKVRLPLATAVSPRQHSGDQSPSGTSPLSNQAAAFQASRVPLANRRGPREVSGRSRIAHGRATVRGYLGLFARSNHAATTSGNTGNCYRSVGSPRQTC